MMNAHGQRIAALVYHIPEAVLWVLILLALASNFGMGYVRGLSNNREPWSPLFITVIMAVMNLLIMDADRPRRGLIQVPNTAMESTAALIDKLDQLPPLPPRGEP